MRILFLYLKAFSSVGGIEKYNKVFIKSLFELSSDNNTRIKILSLYDTSADNRYIDPNVFYNKSGSKTKFFIASIIEAYKSDIIILSHVNLSLVGILIKILCGDKRIFFLTYGIDVWRKPSLTKRLAIHFANRIFTISNFTKTRIIESFNINQNKITILPCAIDPIFAEDALTMDGQHIPDLLSGLQGKKIILTVTRLDKTEKYKGYYNVISALSKVIKKIPDVIYVIVGKGDDLEISNIREFVSKLELTEKVLLAGYVSDKELPQYYNNSDIFVMPSKKEGFGIVYLEALYCGTPVIAGNKDGSYDALQGGRLGFLVDPDDIDEIANKIVSILDKTADQNLINPEYLKKNVFTNFSYDVFKTNLRKNITEFARKQ